jgi:hypothetical protein
MQFLAIAQRGVGEAKTTPFDPAQLWSRQNVQNRRTHTLHERRVL